MKISCFVTLRTQSTMQRRLQKAELFNDLCRSDSTLLGVILLICSVVLRSIFPLVSPSFFRIAKWHVSKNAAGTSETSNVLSDNRFQVEVTRFYAMQQIVRAQSVAVILPRVHVLFIVKKCCGNKRSRYVGALPTELRRARLFPVLLQRRDSNPRPPAP